MALSRQRKILVGVLAVGLAGLAMDRFVLPSPVTGADEAAADLLVEPSGPVAAASPKAVQLPGLAALSKRLEVLAQTSNQAATPRDAFEPSAAWSASGGSEPVAGAAQARSFSQQHQLQAVMSDPRGSLAVVDGRALRLGQKLEGAELVEVRSRSVVFAAEGGKFELQLSTDR